MTNEKRTVIKFSVEELFCTKALLSALIWSLIIAPQ